MFDHQISRFEKRIADLPDQPTLAPDALKAWFDSAPEQLRQALNRVCADGKTLEERMEHEAGRVYGFPFGGFEVRFTVADGVLTVLSAEKV